MMQPFRLATIIVNKASLLISQRKLTFFGAGRATVEGFTADHIVHTLPDGRVFCDCPAYAAHGCCSHSTAYVLLTDRRSRGFSRLHVENPHNEV